VVEVEDMPYKEVRAFLARRRSLKLMPRRKTWWGLITE